ncbi:ABC transporter permease [Mycoplana ramosa]|uniref:ABC transporter permease n=1 Tax=Mycoplana ramosa TaxID=40837 RepID=A0ABW3YYM2_MYCRA
MAVKPKTGWSSLALLVIVAVYILLPMLATLLYSIATSWTTNPLPEGYTAAHWNEAARNDRFMAVLSRSMLLGIAVAAATVALALPAIYWQRIRTPQLRLVLQVLAAVPLTLPILVIALGLLQFSGDYLPAIQGSIGLLFAAHIAIAFPFVYWSLDNSMAAARVDLLSEAARTCGAGPVAVMSDVILPNITPGIATALIMAFGTSFNEVALAQMLIGTRFETVQLYLLNMLKGADANYNLLAVMTVINFVVTLILSTIVIWLNGNAMTGGEIEK